MTNEEISATIKNIIELNQQYYNNEINTKKMLVNLEKEMKEMSTEDLLVLGCALTFISENRQKLLVKFKNLCYNNYVI